MFRIAFFYSLSLWFRFLTVQGVLSQPSNLHQPDLDLLLIRKLTFTIPDDVSFKKFKTPLALQLSHRISFLVLAEPLR